MKKCVFQRFMAILLVICLSFSATLSYSASAATNENSKAASIDFTKISEGTSKSFITKKAYPAGSVVSFDAYIPSDADSWWGVLWTTDPSVGTLYTTSNGCILKSKTKYNEWAEYTVALPQGEDNYYLYFVGERGNNSILVDNFMVTDADGNIIAFDNFNSLLNAGMFYADSKVISLVDYDFYVSVKFNTYSESGIMSMITKEAYPIGTTVSFDAYVPSNIKDGTWWGIAGTTDPASGSIYSRTAGALWSKAKSSLDAWANYSYTLSGDQNSYYLYFIGPRNEWNSDLMIDNVVIKGPDGLVIAEEDFGNGLRNSIFNCQRTNANSSTIITLGAGAVEVSNIAASINMDNICSDTSEPMSFITKAAYAGGSTVSFVAYVPTGASWWNLCWTTDPDTTSIYNHTKNMGKAFTSVKDKWSTYTVTLPDDENNYYFYISGAKGEWNALSLLVDNFLINASDGTTLAVEEFNGGLQNSIFKYAKYNSSGKAIVSEVKEKAETSNAASITVDMVSTKPSSFITKKAYPGGSKIDFEAYIPSEAAGKWWGVLWTTDPSSSSIYNTSSGSMLTSKTVYGRWSKYTLTLPDDGNNYYLYIAAAPGEWHTDTNEKLSILVDNIAVFDKDGYTLDNEDFENGLSDSIIDCTEGPSHNIVSLFDRTMQTLPSYVAATTVDYISDTSASSFITKRAYKGGSTITLDAYIPTNGDKEQWCGIAWTEDPNDTSIYRVGSSGKSFSPVVNNTWTTYTVTLPDDGKSYYIYLCANKGAWNLDNEKLSIKIDNVVIKNSYNVAVDEETFDNGLESSIFSCQQTDSSGRKVVYLLDMDNRDDIVYTTGDINDDGAVNILDIVALKKYIAGIRILSEAGFAAANICNAKGIDALDLGELKRLILTTVNYKDTGITFTAYSAPTVNNALYASDTTKIKSAYQKLSEAGFSKAIALHEGLSTVEGTDLYDTIQQRSAVAEQKALLAMNIAKKYNVKYYVKDWSLYGLGRSSVDQHGFGSDVVSTENQFKSIIENMFSVNNPYVTNPAFAGNLGNDEPYAVDLGSVAYQAKYYYQQMQTLGSSGELMINLLPAYTDSSQNPYSAYIDQYINNIAIPYTGYVCWDYYPFLESNNTNKTARESKYLYNFELIANKCKNNGVKLRTIIQATSDSTGLRSINDASDLKFQIYSGLAFGVNEFIYYSYSGASASDGKCLYNSSTQQYTNVYDNAKIVNNQIMKLGSIYSQYKWDAAMTSNMNSNNMLFGLENTVASHNGTSIAASTGDTLCGAFVANSTSNVNQNAYMFVNVNDLSTGTENEVTVSFPAGTASVAVYRDGVKTVYPVNNNSFTFSLLAGEGVFVIPQK